MVVPKQEFWNGSQILFDKKLIKIKQHGNN